MSIRRSGWRAGSLVGIDLVVDPTFILLLAWIAVVSYVSRGRAADAVLGVVYVLALFGIVVLHELGHALVARRFGVRTRDITLLPIGGVAHLERFPRRPWQQLVVALAGPAVNLALAAVLVAILLLTKQPLIPDEIGVVGGTALTNLIFMNLSLAVFNLLPAFPMDGGRALRAILAMRLPALRATEIAARLGQVTAVGLGVGGVLLTPWLFMIAVFVWVGAEAELRMARLQEGIAGHRVSDLMVSHFEVVAPDETLGHVVERMQRGFQSDFPVVRAERVVAVLGRDDLTQGLRLLGNQAFVSRIMREATPIGPADTVEAALSKMQEHGVHVLPVVDGIAVVGLVTLEQIDLMAANRARRGTPRPKIVAA